MDALLEVLHQRMIATAQQLERELRSVGVTVKFEVRAEADGVSVHVPTPEPKPAPARKKASK